MQLPEAFAGRYSSARFLGARHGGAVGVWLVTPLLSDSLRVLKVASATWCPDGRVLETLFGQNWRANHLALPLEFGHVGQVFYQESEYFPLGALDTQLQRPAGISDYDLLTLVRHLRIALGAIHSAGNGVSIVHADIKPSNILLRSNDMAGERHYLLADFDAAVFSTVDHPGHASGRFTPRYAAPEVLGGGVPSPSADFWSLGIVILECLTGRHPLAAVGERRLRTVLTTYWQPRFGEIEDTYWRALLGGLLERNPGSRWGITEVDRWLSRDPAIVSAGLNLAGERACATPFPVNDSLVFSAMGLGQALLRQWAVRTVASPELLAWVRRDLQRDDLAALIEGLPADDSMDENLRLLHFCHAVVPDMSAIWEGRALTGDNLAAAAQAAMGGDSGNLRWLQSLVDGRCFDFYSRRGHSSVEQIGRTFQDTLSRYRIAWEAIVQQGAPVAARPNEESSLPLAVSLAFSNDMRVALRREAERFFDPASLLVREPWFLHFGTDLGTISDEQLLVLRQLDEVSLLTEINVRALDSLGQIDPQRVRTGVIVAETQRRLLRKLVVRPGSSVIVLGPGDIHRPRQPSTLWEYIADLGTRPLAGIVERLMNWMTRRRGGRAESPGAADLWLQVRLVRVTAGQRAQPIPVQDEVYLALVSWRSPENLRLRLHLRHLALFLSTPRLITSALPPEGRMLLLLTADTRLHLVGRRRWFRGRSRTRPIGVRFDRKAEVVRLMEGLLPLDDLISHPVFTLIDPDTRMRLAQEEVVTIHPGPLPVFGSRDLAPRDDSLRIPQSFWRSPRPSQQARMLWTALQRHAVIERR